MKKIKFIAELAQGYEGKIDQACELIKGAKAGSADFAKIQIVYADELSTKLTNETSGATTKFNIPLVIVIVPIAA